MVKFNELKQKLDKVIELALQIKNNQNQEEKEVDLGDFEIEDLLNTKEEQLLVNYLETLTDEEVHALMSIMYLGRDGYLEFDGNSDEALSYYMKLIDREEKDIEINVMLDKFVLHDYLLKGKYILIEKSKK